MAEYEDLQALLNLDGEEYFIPGNRYWVKFEVKRVVPTRHIPHGLKYSLTLHDSRDNVRIIGYDNAHALPKKKKYAAIRTTWDHKHQKSKVSPYEYESAGQLLEDFWKAVNKYLEEY